MIKITTKTDKTGTPYVKEVFIWTTFKHDDTENIHVDCYFSHSKVDSEKNKNTISANELRNLLSLPTHYIVKVDKVLNFDNFELLKDEIQNLVIYQINSYIEGEKLDHIQKVELL